MRLKIAAKLDWRILWHVFSFDFIDRPTAHCHQHTNYDLESIITRR